MSFAPSIQAGMIGRWSDVARWKPPFLNGASSLSPRARARPLGGDPHRDTLGQLLLGPLQLGDGLLRFLRSMGTNPEATSAGPQMGTRDSSSFITIRMLPGTAPMSAGMSSREEWLDITTYERPGSKCSRPTTDSAPFPERKMRRQ